MSIKELLAVLSDEVEEAAEPLAAALKTLREEESGSDLWMGALEDYTAQVMRLADTAEMLELSGMQLLCTLVVENLVPASEIEEEHPIFTLLAGWTEPLHSWLKEPNDQEKVYSLLDYFIDEGWLVPLESEQIEELAEALQNDVGAANNAYRQEEDQRSAPVALSEADTSIEFSAQASENLRQSFLVEGPKHASSYSEAIQEVMNGNSDIGLLDSARRIIHTLKGAANTLEVKGVANLCHYTEDILEHLVQSGTSPTPALSDLLLRVSDQIEAMLESLMGMEQPPAGRLELLQEVLDWSGRIDRGESLEGATKLSKREATEPSEEAPPTPAPAAEASPPDAAQPEPPTKPAGGQSSPTLHVPTDHIDRLIRQAGEITIFQRQIEGQLDEMGTTLRSMRAQQQLLQQRVQRLQLMVDVEGVSAGSTHATEEQEQEQGMDTLELDRYNELHSHSHAFIEALFDFDMIADQFEERVHTLDSRLAEQARVNTELYQGLLESRMIPVSQITGRLQRAVRNAGHQTGKRVKLEISGETSMVDSYVLTAVAEPIIHLLRNAVDHGIESEERRQQLGKEICGNIHLSFTHEGNKVIIRCTDDGSGMDLERIREKAFAQGRLKEGHPVTDEELVRMVLIPGFSTARELTHLSGRGIGMDVVHDSIAKLKGTIDISNRPGKGLQTTLRLPVTLATSDTLLVSVEGDVVALLLDEVEQVIHAGAQQIERMGNHWAYRSAEAAYPVERLSDILSYPSQKEVGSEGDDRPLLLVKSDEKRICLLVDKVLDSQQLVMKNPGRHLGRLPGVVGISVLGDGRVTPVVDVWNLLGKQNNEIRRSEATGQGMDNRVLSAADIMVVDDSLSVRRSLEQLLNDSGYRARPARDGFEAVKSMTERMPDALLVDMEMPRMNGLELTEHVRSHPEGRHTPIIMITSRSQEQHRDRALQAGVDAYLTKPYQESELLDLIDHHLSRTTEAREPNESSPRLGN